MGSIACECFTASAVEVEPLLTTVAAPTIPAGQPISLPPPPLGIPPPAPPNLPPPPDNLRGVLPSVAYLNGVPLLLLMFVLLIWTLILTEPKILSPFCAPKNVKKSTNTRLPVLLAENLFIPLLFPLMACSLHKLHSYSNA